jgi:hypothetical protein
MFVDDLILASETLADMKAQYGQVRSQFISFGCVINVKKTRMVAPNDKEAALSFLEEIGCKKSNLQPSLKYLGVIIQPPYNQTSWAAHTKSRIQKAKAMFHLMMAKGLKVGGSNVAVCLEVYHKVIQPILFYGAEIWEPTKESLTTLDRAQAYILGRLLGLPSAAPRRWVLWEAPDAPTPPIYTPHCLQLLPGEPNKNSNGQMANEPR